MNPAIIAACKARVASLVEAFPELSEDENFRRDMIEGGTDLFLVVDRLAREARVAKAECAGLKDAAVEMVARAGKKAEREQAIRTTLAGILEAADLPKVKTATASVSFQPIKSSVVVTDEAALPAAFLRTRTEPDKNAIKAALEAGEVVPGAEMSNGGRALRIS